jgi:hypothetical protein
MFLPRNFNVCDNHLMVSMDDSSYRLILIQARRTKSIFGPKVVHFPARNTEVNTKFANFEGLYFPHFTTFFAAKLYNFTNFNMLFLAVVMDFVLLAYIKISL